MGEWKWYGSDQANAKYAPLGFHHTGVASWESSGDRRLFIGTGDGRLIALLLLAEIGVPGMIAGACPLSEVLANPVGAGEPAEIAGARNRAGDEKRHGFLRTRRLALRHCRLGRRPRPKVRPRYWITVHGTLWLIDRPELKSPAR